MIDFLFKKLGYHRNPVTQPAPNAQQINSNLRDPFDAGKADGTLNGSYDENTGLIYPGLKVGVSDVVLDVGCGDSPFTEFSARMGANVIFADIDPEKIAAMESRLQMKDGQTATGLVTDANPLPLDANTATHIISTEVIEHVDDPRSFLHELFRVGKPGATYLLSAPSPTSEQLQVGIAAPDYFEKPNHIRIIGHDEFREMVEAAGLIVETQDLTGFYWTVWWMFFWISNQDTSPPWSPLLTSWSETWSLLMANPRAAEIKTVLDNALPKNQIIVARKPIPSL